MLNCVTLMGRLTADPVLKTTTTGKEVCQFSIAVDRSYAGHGEKQSDFITIVAWEAAARFVVNYFTKGSMIAIQGSVQSRSYEDKKGNKRTAFEVVGIYQDIYKKEQGVNADSAAKQLMKVPEKTAKVTAIGDIRCTSGKSIYLYDDFTGLWGKFWIENDTHLFSDGVHTMTLELAFKNVMENVEESASSYPVATSERVCYYTEDGEKYHSKSSCSSMTNPTRSTVSAATKLGKSKCSRCWQ